MEWSLLAAQLVTADATRWRIWTACAFGGLAQSLAGAAGSLLADELGGSAAWAGLPQSLQVAGTAVASVALSKITSRRGRRAALAIGAAVATFACALAVLGAARSDLRWLLVASAPIGAGNAAVLLGRYAAADLAPEGQRPHAMGLALTAITVGAVAGPNLLAPSALLSGFGGPALGGAYVLSGLGFAAAGLVLRGGPRDGLGAALTASSGPTPPGRAADASNVPPTTRPLPSMRPGLVVLATANLVMIAVMTMAPVHLHRHGTGLGTVGLVVSLHVAAMFAPSSLSAWAVYRAGPKAVAAASGLVIAASSAAAAAAPSSLPVMFAAMAALGVGWNLALVSGSTMITEGALPEARPRREGRGEFVMGVAAGLGGAGAGAVVAATSYSMLAVLGAVVALVIVGTVLTTARRVDGGSGRAHHSTR